MKLWKSLIFWAALSVSFSVYAFEEKYYSGYDSGDVFDAIKEGAFKRAGEILYEIIRETVTETLEDPEKVKELLARVLVKVAEKLEEIINGTGSDVEKGQEILKLIEADLGSEKSNPTGALGLYYQYSFDFSTAKLSWNRKEEELACLNGFLSYECGWVDKCNIYECWQEWQCGWVEYYDITEYKVEPDYEIYRIVNGQSRLITIIYGGVRDRTTTFGSEGVSWSGIIRYQLGDEDSIDPDKGVFYDFDTDFRPEGSTLDYRVVASSGRFFRSNNCQEAGYWSTIATADGDGNGFLDFIADPHQEIFRRYYPWLPVIITSILN